MRINFRSAKAQAPQEEQGVSVEYAAGKRGGFKRRWYLLLALVVSPVLLLLWITAKGWVLVTAPGIVTTNPLDMIAPGVGEVEQIFVREGDAVEKGQLLIQLKDRILDYEIQEIEQQLQRMEQFSRQPQMIALLEHRIEQAHLHSEQIKGLLAKIDSYKGGVFPAADQASLLQSYNASLQVLSVAQMELEATEQGYHLDNSLAQSRRQLQQQLAVLDARKENLEVRAPYDGQVSNLLVQPRARVSNAQSLLFLSGGEPVMVEAYLEPRHLDYSEIGQEVSIKLPNGQKFSARVARHPEMAGRVPAVLKGPFDGEKPALLLRLAFDRPPAERIPEGLPVQVRFDRLSKLTR